VLVAIGVVALAVLPVVVATVRAVARGWVPLSDDAYFSIRATDVFSRQIPLVGMATSASLNAKQHLNHPGPILFDLLAVPVRGFGSTAGVAIGIGITNTLAIAGACWVAYRRGGVLLVIPAALVACGLTWTMGSELLFDPWQPHALLLPFLCFLFLAWGLAEGDLLLLPIGVGVGTFLVQTHVSYSYLVPALGLVGVLGLAWRLRARVRGGEETGAHLRRRLAWAGGVTVVVLVVSWIQPVIDQVARNGNLLHLLQASGDAAGPTLGGGRALRVVASVVSLPPFFLRDSFASTLAAQGTATGGPGGVGLARLPSLALAAASFGVLALVLVVTAVLARWRRPRCGAGAAPVIALVGLAVGYFTATRIPIEVFGVAEHNFRWLWPLAAFSAFSVLAVAVRLLTAPGDATAAAPPDDAGGQEPAPLSSGTRIAAGVGIALVALLSILTLPTYDAGVGPNVNLWAEPILRDLDHQIAADPPRGPLLADFSNTFFLEPFSTPLLAQLQRSGVGFVTADEVQVRQIGPARRFDGHNARARLAYRQGAGARVTPAGWRRIAYHPGLDRADRRELRRLEASGEQSARRTELERLWGRDSVAVYVAPLHGPSARNTP
jgi:hypothetical protein